MDIQLIIRLWNTQLFEKYFRHIGIKMLTSMNDDFRKGLLLNDSL